MKHCKSSVYLVSLGCPKNRVDAEVMLYEIERGGYRITDQPSQADIIIVNTCGFIDAAKKESVDVILEMADYKDPSVGVCKKLMVSGCLSQRYSGELPELLPEVDALIGVTQYPDIAAILDRSLESEFLCECQLNLSVTGSSHRILTDYASYAYLKIGEGCNNRCSYCSIPAIRGSYRSRPIEELLEEVDFLVQSGKSEIILISQDTTKYGIDLPGNLSLDILLEEVAKHPGVEWVRVLYLYPETLTQRMIEVILSNPKICSYFDLPLQHVDDEILQTMHRMGRRIDIERIYRTIRERDAEAVLRSTFIVGFPGETPEQFQTLMDFLAEYPIDNVGAFPYSPEEGTPAAKMPNQIAEDVKQSRYDTLMSAQTDISLSLNRQRIGSVMSCIIEGYDDKQQMFFGRTQEQSPDIDGITYVMPNDDIEIGQYINIKIVDAMTYDLIGEKTHVAGK